MQLHESDFYTWTRRQAELLRAGQFGELDTANLIGELDSMGARERRELVNRLAVLLAHLLKWRDQPERQGNSWRRTIRIQRIEVADLLGDNPGLKPELADLFVRAYAKARILATDETRFDESTFPSEAPFTLEETLDPAFFPTE
ncbi:hypothetical protein CCR95_08870 [Thiocystis minor]|nr:hypothetical protein [Thiocystis minor]